MMLHCRFLELDVYILMSQNTMQAQSSLWPMMYVELCFTERPGAKAHRGYQIF